MPTKTAILTETEWQEFVKEHADESKPCEFCQQSADFRVTSRFCGCAKYLCSHHTEAVIKEMEDIQALITPTNKLRCAMCRRQTDSPPNPLFTAVRIK